MKAEVWANRTYIRVMTADIEGAIISSDCSFEIARSIDNLWGQVNARGFLGLVYMARGEIDRALQTVNDLIPSAQKIGHPGHYLGLFCLARIYAQLGASDLRRQTARRSLEEPVDFPPFLPLAQVLMAGENIRTGAWAEAQTLLTQARRGGARQVLQMIDLVVDLVTFDYHLARQELEPARQVLDGMLRKMDETGVRYFVPEALLRKADVQRQQGHLEQAIATLEQARAVAEEIDAKVMLWQILALLGEREAARRVVDVIADNISDPELQRLFRSHSATLLDPKVNTF
jgi:tetratricopeptide (TPR) repeat protein